MLIRDLVPDTSQLEPVLTDWLCGWYVVAEPWTFEERPMPPPTLGRPKAPPAKGVIIPGKVMAALRDEWQTTKQIAIAAGLSRETTRRLLRAFVYQGTAEHMTKGGPFKGEPKQFYRKAQRSGSFGIGSRRKA